jgi:predicted TIM-barrel fold metal-dependent hydrolase
MPNVYAKISGLGMVDWHWTDASIRPFVLTVIDLFGVERCMFASNFPVDRLYSGFTELYAAFQAAVSGFAEHEKRQLFAGTAAAVYRL